jgi:hypothetical protein
MLQLKSIRVDGVTHSFRSTFMKEHLLDKLKYLNTMAHIYSDRDRNRYEEIMQEIKKIDMQLLEIMTME